MYLYKVCVQQLCREIQGVGERRSIDACTFWDFSDKRKRNLPRCIKDGYSKAVEIERLHYVYINFERNEHRYDLCNCN